MASSGLRRSTLHSIRLSRIDALGFVQLRRAAYPTGRSLTVLIATAIGTSLDAMAVGVSLAFLDVNIMVVAIAIGLATFVMSSGGMLIGRLIGERFGKMAEIAAGIALCGLGSFILFEHLTAV